MPKRYNGVLFEDICEEIQRRYKADPSRKTYKTSRAPIKHLLETFRGKMVRSMSPDDFYLCHVPRVNLAKPGRNLNNERKLFIQVMFIAYRRGLIRVPPTGIKKPSPEESAGKEIPQAHIDALLRSCKNPSLKLQIEIALLTGMRVGEIVRLKWEWIDLETGIIFLSPRHTKTKRGRRVPLNGYLCRRFREWKELPKPFLFQNREHVFPSRHFPWKPADSNKTAWKTLLRDCGLKYRFHDLRHTNATRRVRAGTPEGTIARVLGMSPQILRDIYSHLSTEDLTKSAEDVSDIIQFEEQRRA